MSPTQKKIWAIAVFLVLLVMSGIVCVLINVEWQTATVELKKEVEDMRVLEEEGVQERLGEIIGEAAREDIGERIEDIVEEITPIEMEDMLEDGEGRCIGLDIARRERITVGLEKVRSALRNRLTVVDFDEAVPVIIRYSREPSSNCLDDLKQRRVQVRRWGVLRDRASFEKRFHLINAVSANLTQSMIGDVLIHDNAVVQVELDLEVHDFMDRSIPHIEAERVREGLDITGRGVKIAVIDTGIASDNEALQGKVVSSVNFTEDDDAEDLRGHGTHSACIIACDSDEYRGVAPGSQIYNLKAIDNEGHSRASLVMAAIESAADLDVDIINLSLGADINVCDGTDALSVAVDSAVEAGAIVVAAAGNSGPAEHTLTTPGCARKAITVGATDYNNTIVSFSSHGPTDSDYGKPDIYAPGSRIRALTYGGEVKMMSGTSQAAPHVTGVAALLKEANEGLSRDEVLDILIRTQSFLNANEDGYIEEGRGVVNAYMAIDDVINGDVGDREEEEDSHYEASVGGDLEEEIEEIEEIEEPEASLEQEVQDKSLDRDVTEEQQEYEKLKYLDLRADFSSCIKESGGDQDKRAFCSSQLLEDQRFLQLRSMSQDDQLYLILFVEKVMEINAAIDSLDFLSAEAKSKFEKIAEDIEDYVFMRSDIDQLEGEMLELESYLDKMNALEIESKISSLEKTTYKTKQRSLNSKFVNDMLPFKDVDDNKWYFAYVSDLKQLGCISGYKDFEGNDLFEYRSGNSLTVAEGLKIVLECASYDEEDTAFVTEVLKAKGHWVEDYFNKGGELGISLILDPYVDPDRPLTRAETIILFLEAFGKAPLDDIEYFFVDLDENAKETIWIESARELGIISGDAYSPAFRPDDPVNRAEMSKIVLEGMDVVSTESVDSESDMF